MGNPEVLLRDEPSDGFRTDHRALRRRPDQDHRAQRHDHPARGAECRPLREGGDARRERGRIVFHDTMQALATNAEIKGRYSPSEEFPWQRQ